MQIMTLVLRRLLHFHLDAMRVSPRVLTNAGYRQETSTPGLLVLTVKLPLFIFAATMP